MLERIRPRLTYANVVVTALAFIVLGGGTAVAAFVVNSNDEVAPDVIAGHAPPAGDHANIIGGSVAANDLASGAVTTSKIAADSVNAGKVVDHSLTADELRDASFLRAKTSVLRTGGGEQMFKIGRVTLGSFCTNNDGTLSAGIEPTVQADGPVLVTGDSFAALHPFDVEFVVIVSDASDLNAKQASFSILDRRGVSASGVAAASVDPANGRCVVTAHAVG
jgi:hypothetical protein